MQDGNQVDRKSPSLFSVGRALVINVGFVLQCALFLIALALTVLSIGELASREALRSFVQLRITEHKSSLADDRSIQVNVGATPESTRGRMLETLHKVERLNEIHTRIESLMLAGSSRPQSRLPEIQYSFEELQTSGKTGVLIRYAEESIAKQAVMLPVDTLTESSSEALLAIVVIFAGAVGAMISSLREGTYLTLRSFVLGLASGFIVLLLLKGGRNVFLFQLPGQVVPFNPYGVAFAGLLAGLFTERAHQLLSWLIDDLISRVRAASQSGPK